LAQQIFYPDYFGGAWGFCPDPVDFHAFQMVNVYNDKSAYFDQGPFARVPKLVGRMPDDHRSEEHTSELQSHLNIVCRRLLEKKIEELHDLQVLDANRLVRRTAAELRGLRAAARQATVVIAGAEYVPDHCQINVP